MSSSDQQIRTHRRLAAVLFGDMVGYTRLMEESESQALRLREEFQSLAAKSIPTFSGEIVKTMGDGFFAAFNSTVEAVRFALSFQKDLDDRNRRQTSQQPLLARIGIHLGDLLQEGDDLFGSGVNVASRMESLAEPGGICISGEVYQQVKNQEGLSFRDLGERLLHNIPEPVRIYALEPKAEEVVRPQTPSGLKAIAVLPFHNISPDPENEYFSDGMTEEIITHLSKIGGLKVASRSAVFRYKGKSVDPREVGRELRVESVLEGSVRKHGNRLRITAQLIGAADGFHLWSEEYDRDLEDVFGIQSDIAQRVGEALRVRLTAGEKQQIQKKATKDVEAYSLYLKGRYHWNKRNEEGLKKGIEFFQQAIDRDPDYALAYVGLADCYLILGAFGYSILPPREAMPPARTAVIKALEIDDTLGEAHASLAAILHWYDWDWPGAEREFQRAIQLKPDYAIVHLWYSLYLLRLGRVAEALAEIKRALELDPLSLIIQSDMAFILTVEGHYDQAIQAGRNALEMDPNFAVAHFFLGMAYEQKQMYQEAITEFQKAIRLSGGLSPYVSALGHAYAVMGKKNEAHKVLNELQERRQRTYTPAYEIALVYAGLGEKEQTYEWLERAYQERSAFLIHLKIDPRLYALHSDARFIELLKKIGLEK